MAAPKGGIEPATFAYRTSMLPLQHEYCTVCGQTWSSIADHTAVQCSGVSVPLIIVPHILQATLRELCWMLSCSNQSHSIIVLSCCCDLRKLLTSASSINSWWNVRTFNICIFFVDFAFMCLLCSQFSVNSLQAINENKVHRARLFVSIAHQK